MDVHALNITVTKIVNSSYRNPPVQNYCEDRQLTGCLMAWLERFNSTTPPGGDWSPTYAQFQMCYPGGAIAVAIADRDTDKMHLPLNVALCRLIVLVSDAKVAVAQGVKFNGPYYSY